MNSLMPAARASSIAYWINGRSTSGRISFGTDLVAGRNLVPKPATGKTAFVTFLVITTSLLASDSLDTNRHVTMAGAPVIWAPWMANAYHRIEVPA